MKFKLIVLLMALNSFSAYGADNTSSAGQSNAANGQTQTATLQQDKSKQTGNPADATKGQQTDDHAVSSWSLLGQGWKDIDRQQGK